MKAKEAAETYPASGNPSEPKPKLRRRETKRRRKVRRRRQKVFTHFLFSFPPHVIVVI